MGFQSFSHKMALASAISAASRAERAPLTQEEKDRRKRLNKERDDARRAENLAQRALIESRRTY